MSTAKRGVWGGAVRGVVGFGASVGGGTGPGRRGGFAVAAPVAVLNLGGDCRILLYTPACDMRRSFDGLSALVRNELGANPTNGPWYVFVNRRRTMLKVLAFDAGGYWIWSKRLERTVRTQPLTIRPRPSPESSRSLANECPERSRLPAYARLAGFRRSVAIMPRPLLFGIRSRSRSHSLAAR